MDQLVTNFLLDAFEAEVGECDAFRSAGAAGASALWDRHVREVRAHVDVYRNLLEDLARDSETDAAGREVMRRIVASLDQAVSRAVDATRRECAAADVLPRSAHN